MEHVKVILLRKVARLGSIGDIVNVKPGFARNYLLPKKIALRATNENKKYFEEKRTQIEAANAESRADAQKVADKAQALTVTLVRQASEKGHLYGSVSCRDIAAAVKSLGIDVVAGQVNLHSAIKQLGIYELSIDLHPEVSLPLTLSIAKSEEEARQQISATPITSEAPATVVASEVSETSEVA